jgi:DnaK suppressor protein
MPIFSSLMVVCVGITCDACSVTEDLDVDAVAAHLRERKRDLEERIGGFAKAPERGALLGFGKRIGDGTSEAITRITEAGVGGTLEVTLAKVDRALDKIDEGTYGMCDSCGQPIAPGRLKAMPESTLCVQCAARA